MLAELRAEMIKLLKKPRTYIGPVGITCLVILLMVGMKYGHEFRHMQRTLMQDFIISGSFVNAAFLTRYILLPPILLMFLPLFTCTVFGDLIAAETADGTIRTLLCRPVSRTSVAVSKYLIGMWYAVKLTFWMGLAAYVLGMIFLGRGSLLSFIGGLWIIPEAQAIIRLIEVYALVALGMIAIGSMSFAISTFVNNSNGAIAAAVGLVVASGIIGEIEYFSFLKPYLLTTYLLDLSGLFKDRLDLALYGHAALVFGVYAVSSLLVGLAVFRRRDVLS